MVFRVTNPDPYPIILESPANVEIKTVEFVPSLPREHADAQEVKLKKHDDNLMRNCQEFVKNVNIEYTTFVKTNL